MHEKTCLRFSGNVSTFCWKYAYVLMETSACLSPTVRAALTGRPDARKSGLPRRGKRGNNCGPHLAVISTVLCRHFERSEKSPSTVGRNLPRQRSSASCEISHFVRNDGNAKDVVYHTASGEAGRMKAGNPCLRGGISVGTRQKFRRHAAEFP